METTYKNLINVQLILILYLLKITEFVTIPVRKMHDASVAFIRPREIMFALSYEASYNPYTLKKYIRIEVKGYIKNTKLNILNTKACSRKLEDNLVSEGFSK